MQLVDFENATICHINEKTHLFTAEKWIGDEYYGCNLYAIIDDNLTLLETYDDENKITGRGLANNVIQSINDGFTAGATYYKIPPN